MASLWALRGRGLATGALVAVAVFAMCTTGAVAALPASRGYELVSPPVKGGSDVIAQSYKTFSAVDGNSVAFVASGAFGQVRGTSTDVQYLSRRDGSAGENGWQTKAISPSAGSQTLFALAFSNFPTFEAAFSDDLTGGVYKAWRPMTDAPNVAGVSNLYRLRSLDSADPQTELLTDSVAPLVDVGILRTFYQNAFNGASSDLTHVIFQSPWNLLGDGALDFNGVGDLYEYADGVGVRRVGRVPSPPASQCDDNAGPVCVDVANAQAGVSASIEFGLSEYSASMISQDGARIAFQAGGALFLRENGIRTYQLNASEKATPESPQGAAVWEMSRDGTRVFFTTSEGLVDGDDNANADVYMYDLTADEGSRLTVLSVNASGESCFGKGVVGASSDGRRVFFWCDGQLAPEDPFSVNGLFEWHNGAVTYLGRFDDFNSARTNTPRTPWQLSLFSRTSRVTPDGRYLLFMAIRGDGFRDIGGFAGYNQAGHRQIYLYSADTRRLVCVSCNPRSDVARGDALTDVFAGLSASAITQHLSHALSDDGKHVFFSSPEALVAEDSNGKWDAYEYDVQSGTLHLISNGTGPADSYFLDASPDGDDVFFATRERLVGWDVDENYDLYDARVGGGFPEPVPAAAPCAGEACRAGGAVAPAAATGASARFRGAGDARARLRRHKRCRRGKVLRRVRGRRKCAKRRARRVARQVRRVPDYEGPSSPWLWVVAVLASGWCIRVRLGVELERSGK